MHNTRPSLDFTHPSGSAPAMGGFGVTAVADAVITGGGAWETCFGATVVGEFGVTTVADAVITDGKVGKAGKVWETWFGATVVGDTVVDIIVVCEIGLALDDVDPDIDVVVIVAVGVCVVVCVVVCVLP
jgi:hypothetical protein